VGNMRTYGQYADDSTFEIVPRGRTNFKPWLMRMLCGQEFLTTLMRFMITS
jgi:hypothetical protein